MKPFDYSKIPTLSASQLKKELDKVSGEWDKLITRMIDCGRGHELPSETLKRAESEDNDKLSCEYAVNAYRRQSLYAEKQARQSYHGSLKPIPTA